MRFIDLFCGIGGFRLGLEKSNGQQQRDTEVGGCGHSVGNQGEQPNQSEKWGNYTCVWSNDNDKYACQIYRRHFGEVHEGDIRTVDVDTIPEHDLLCAGFPCQSFSIAGKRRGFEDTRGTLFFEICRVLRAKRPGYLLLENVRGLLSHDNGRTFSVILSSLDELGYDCQWDCLNSKDYGVPQNRERVFIVGHTRGKPRPKVFPIGETTRENNLECVGIMKEGYESMPTFDGYNYLPRHRIYDSTGISRGLASHEDQMPFIKTGQSIRRLTPLECERLQGFPDGWTEGISDTQRYKVLGNAVTVNVIEAIGKELNANFAS